MEWAQNGRVYRGPRIQDNRGPLVSKNHTPGPKDGPAHRVLPSVGCRVGVEFGDPFENLGHHHLGHTDERRLLVCDVAVKLRRLDVEPFNKSSDRQRFDATLIGELDRCSENDHRPDIGH